MPEAVGGSDVAPTVIRPDLRRYTIGERRLPLAELPSALASRALTEPEGRLLKAVYGDNAEAATRLGISPVLANNPKLAERFTILLNGLLFDGALPARTREIVILRMGWRCGAVFEFGAHSKIAREVVGLSPDEIRRITMPTERSGFAPHEAILLRLVDELYEGNMVSDETWSELASRWSPAELVELVAVAGFYWMGCTMLNSFRVEPDDMQWPEGVTPVGLG